MTTSLTPNEIREQIDEHRGEIETTEQNGHRAIKEPLVYRSDSKTSYFMDLAAQMQGDSGASERLSRHGRQMADLPPQEARSFPETEFRVNPNTTEGTGGEFAPPLWLNRLFATARRPGQIIQRLAHTFDFPAGASSINLPRITTGTVAAPQVPGAPVASQDVETASPKSNAVVFAGNSDWSIQSLEQSPRGAHLDWVVFTDLAESFDAEVERELILGKGETGELLGLLNITGINTVANSGAVEPKVAFTELAKAMGGVGRNRKRPPDAWLMTTARLAWLAMGADTEQRPLILTDNVGEEWPPASLASVAVYPDDAIPITVNVNQEPVFCVRSDDFLIWLSQPKTAVLEEVLSGSLGVRFRLHRSVAAILGRYPSGISAVTGSGMKAQQGATEYSYS